MSPTRHYSDTFRDRIKPGLSVQYSGNPCTGNHRADGGRVQTNTGSLLIEDSDGPSSGERSHFFCEVEQRRHAALSCHICDLGYETEMDLVSVLIHRRWRRRGTEGQIGYFWVSCVKAH